MPLWPWYTFGGPADEAEAFEDMPKRDRFGSLVALEERNRAGGVLPACLVLSLDEPLLSDLPRSFSDVGLKKPRLFSLLFSSLLVP